jgi:hypothetical protein
MRNATRAKGLLIVREPNGRLSRSSINAVDAVSPAEAVRLRNAAIAGMRAPEWATEIGRLFLEGKVTAAEFEAGKRWGRLVGKYQRAVGAPRPWPKGQAFDRSTPSSGDDEPTPDTEAGRKALEALATARRDIIDDMRIAHAVLVGAGMLSERAVRSTCEANEVPVGAMGLGSLKEGLNWLALHWGLTQPNRAA